MAEDRPVTRRRSRRRWLAWALLLFVSGGLVFADTVIEVDRISRQRAWQAAMDAQARQTRVVLRALGDRIAPERGRTEEALRGPWRLDLATRVVVGEHSVRYMIPAELIDARAAGYRAMFIFERDTLAGYAVNPPTRPPRPTFTLWVSFHRGLIIVALVAAGAWLTFILAAFYDRSRQAAFAELSLGAALLALAAGAIWRLGPYDRDSSALSHAATVVGLTMLIVSGVSLISGVRRRRRDEEGLCARCRYNLTGNESGVCPECGTPTAAGLRRKRAAEVQAVSRALDGAAGAGQGDAEHVAALK